MSTSAESFREAQARGQARVFNILAVVTIVYFAILGGIHYSQSGLVGIVMTLLPVIVVVVTAQRWGKLAGGANGELQRSDYMLASVIAALVCLAGVLAVVLPHPIPSALSGVIPAAAWIAVAWRVARR